VRGDRVYLTYIQESIRLDQVWQAIVQDLPVLIAVVDQELAQP
jgi:hypothetical protein